VSTLRAARAALAAGITASGLGVHGYARPPGAVHAFPAAVVLDPRTVVYHDTGGKRTAVELAVRVLVGRQASQDSVARLDDLVSRSQMPVTLEQIDGPWTELACLRLDGGYADYRQGEPGQIVAVAADLVCQLRFNNTTT